MNKFLAPALLAITAFLSGLAPVLPQVAFAEEDQSQLTEEELKEALQFIYGNAMFVLLHEAGHMLISELQLPVLGREEDAVDTLSSILLLEAHDDTLDKAITDSADGWFLSDDSREAEGGEMVFWDTHGLDKQRAYQMVCMMVGQDAEGFKDFADSVDLPKDRREECQSEYQNALQSWTSLLSPHSVGEGEKNKITIAYEEPTEELAPYAQMSKDAKLLEGMSDLFSDLFKLNDGIQFVATTCGQPNAYWMPGERKLVYCYELAAYHGQLISKWLLENRNTDTDQVSEASGATKAADEATEQQTDEEQQ